MHVTLMVRFSREMLGRRRAFAGTAKAAAEQTIDNWGSFALISR